MNIYYILIGILLYVFIFSLSTFLMPIREGYESYERCVEQGYPHNFCFYDVPVISML
jgi:hypothetical protein